jgi:2-keto-3-deoxy-6-phosphogluconate aldolase
LSRLFDAYRAFHEQGFIPIFVHDDLDSKMLVDACIEAGARGIEYTLRRRDANEMIPWIRENYPNLYLLAGSTMDNEGIVGRVKRRHPQALTVAELDAMDVDGFVSMMAYSEQSIRKYAPTRLLMPCAMTSNEAFFQIGAGAHFAKLIGPDVEMVKRCRAVPTYDYCPIMITGGMTTQRIPEAVTAGAVLIGSGFDLMLKGERNPTRATIVQRLREFIEVTAEARAKQWPEMAAAMGGDAQAWLDSLPHIHPF